jgi:hypothetical protein
MKKSVLFTMTIVMSLNAVSIANASERTASVAGITQEERISLRADLQVKISEAQTGIASLEKSLKEKQNNGAGFDAFNSTSVSVLLAAVSMGNIFAKAESVTDRKLNLKFAGLTALAALASTAVAISDVQFVNLTEQQVAELQEQIKAAKAELETLQARLTATAE